MSLENVDIVRLMLIEFERSKRLTEAWAPDLVWEMPWSSGSPRTTEYHGRDGFCAFLAEWLGPYDRWEQPPEDVLDAGGNQVVAVLLSRGPLSGTEDWLNLRYGVVYTLEGGLIRRARAYLTAEEAVEAAGLSDEAPSAPATGA